MDVAGSKSTPFPREGGGPEPNSASPVTLGPRLRGGTASGSGAVIAHEFAFSATRLAGLSGILFAWSPDTFWAATPAELGALIVAIAGDAADPPDAAIVAQLKETFPDG